MVITGLVGSPNGLVGSSNGMVGSPNGMVWSPNDLVGCPKMTNEEEGGGLAVFLLLE